jgi:hypothetical protein
MRCVERAFWIQLFFMPGDGDAQMAYVSQRTGYNTKKDEMDEAAY